MNKPHKWAEVIKAWADGAEIQYRLSNAKWVDFELSPHAADALLQPYAEFEFRIKPKKKSPGEALMNIMAPTADWNGKYTGDKTREFYDHAGQSIINAYKAGDIDEI